ncbi:Hsp20/alpha crystallin family protein [Halodesulfovibrio marinisediminis]|uniref:Heat shock protein Hsp20 n=1 Tax=Halodesulfovibrio marinisediminis DSM 17456 TaxID=1121457 RepID=A0A1N6H592_9BACT|nr:Hsp20/alpha crystallin family protein [Halodesulfovibrio marinisediminis]SIO14981.1 heat shock protein Hsp20 [Halodesulfovibrio marinisediminis DSM 17456]
MTASKSKEGSMVVSRLNPWNWFKRESEQEKILPAKHAERRLRGYAPPFDQFHAEFDRMLDSMFSDFGFLPPRHMVDVADKRLEHVMIKPKIDVYGTEKEYVIEADLPGIEEEDLSIELKNDLLILSAEKKFEEKKEDKGYYRVERSYGSFRRVLNIPEDADKDNIKAKLEHGVLCITMPRAKSLESSAKKIAIESSSSK